MSLEELIRRNRYKWSVNEVLNLQREYELQELTIQEIALLHKRSVFSILNKLEKEHIIINFSDVILLGHFNVLKAMKDDITLDDLLSNPRIKQAAHAARLALLSHLDK